MTITRVNHLKAADGKQQQMFNFLTELKNYIANSPGCVECQLLRNQDNDCAFVVIELWQDVESHRASLANFPQEDMQAAMSLFGEPPSGAYYQTID
ncbi:antibiotic biosynthesis monooxygenase [Thalassotalea sp. HSM 43]|uniref:putative quinol monooxygenase n=1 Tax=Thalassotalea sp. HSM 43 TaxID=2552945 RepID=UPI00108202A2|nr:antibiotic biosynthesis monooxygenase family protein [Thalassotalea sp. HSM 43]QBY05603.1 antibiotic biosynthesis monooxygenase [Thalassotalea sp. HSM 43]